MSDQYLLVKDVYQLIALLDRRVRECEELMEACVIQRDRAETPELWQRCQDDYIYNQGWRNGLNEAMEYARKLADYNPAKLQTSFDFVAEAEPIFTGLIGAK